MLKTEEFYLALLESANVTPEKSNEWLFMNGAKKPLALTIRLFNESEAKPVVVPSRETMRAEEDFGVIKFHPLAESIFRGQSEVFNKLHTILSLRLFTYATALCSEILTMAIDDDRVAALRTKPQNRLSKLGKVTKTSVQYFRSVVRSATPAGMDNPFVGLAVERGDGSHRSCKLVPYATTNDGNAILGVAPKSQSSYNVVQKLFEMIMPEDFAVESKSKTAPYFMSMVTCYAEAMQHMYDMAKVFGLGKMAKLDVDLSWSDDLADIEAIARKEIPAVYSGNEGVDIGAKEAVQPEPQQQQPRPAPKPTPAPAHIDAARNGSYARRQPTSAAPQRRVMYKDADVAPIAPIQQPVVEQRVMDEQPHRPAPRVASTPREVVSRKAPPRPKVAQHQHAPLPLEQVYDIDGRALTCMDGSPFELPSHEVPVGIWQVHDQRGQPMYDNTGYPVLQNANGGGHTARGGMYQQPNNAAPAASVYGQPAQPGYQQPARGNIPMRGNIPANNGGYAPPANNGMVYANQPPQQVYQQPVYTDAYGRPVAPPQQPPQQQYIQYPNQNPGYHQPLRGNIPRR